jgi:hypothetical protein
MIECHNQKCKHHERWFLKEESGPYCHAPYCRAFDKEPDCPNDLRELLEAVKRFGQWD